LRIIEDKGKAFCTTFHQNMVGSGRICEFSATADTIRIVQEAGWALGLVWIDVEDLVPTRV
jgi:hypothetical protein